MAKYTACICEGGAERAVLDLLLDNHMLIFEREQLIEEEVLRCRSAKEFEEKHLKKGFQEKITVIVFWIPGMKILNRSEEHTSELQSQR